MDPLPSLILATILPLSVTASVVIGLAAQRWFNRKTLADLQAHMRETASINVKAAQDMRAALLGDAESRTGRAGNVVALVPRGEPPPAA